MINDFLKKSFEKIDDLLVNNQLPNGHNGPYRDNETDVRKTAHLMVFYANVIKSNLYSDSTQIRNQLVNFKNSLINNSNYKGGAYFRCRIKPGKDEVNGVIGIAWVIEGLCASYEVLQDDEILVFLDKIVKSLKFNKLRSLWERPVNSKLDKTGVDETYNHQLWLGYALVYYAKVSRTELLEEVKSFFFNVDIHLNVRKSGLIVHGLKNKTTLKNKVKTILKDFKIYVLSKKNKTTTAYKENGYHLFSVFAFARIKDLGFENLFSSSLKVQKAVSYASNKELYAFLTSNKEETDYYAIKTTSNLENNRYGFPYNVSGFEFVYINLIFNLKTASLGKKYFDKQLEVLGFTKQNNYFTNDTLTEDSINLFLRVYELSYCLNYKDVTLS